MKLSKELTEALRPLPEEETRNDWIFQRHHVVLTNQRLVMLSFYHLRGHPHHDVLWEQKLESMRSVEVQQGSPVRGDDTQPTTTNVGTAASGGSGIFQSNPGPSVIPPVLTQGIPGNSYVVIDNMEVFRGSSVEASHIADEIQKAIIYREHSLKEAVPLITVVAR